MKIIEETVATKYVVFDNGVKEKFDTVLEYLNDMDSFNIENTYTWFYTDDSVDMALFHFIINKDTFNDKVGIINDTDEDEKRIHWKENASEFINNLIDELCTMPTDKIPTVKVITIPENATNGDMIKELFPNAEIKHGLYGIEGLPLVCLCLNTNFKMYEAFFAENWWDAPYRKSEDEE